MRKNILILIDEKNNNQEFQELMNNVFQDVILNIIVFDSGEYFLKNNIVSIDLFISISDYVLNFLELPQEFEKIQKKIENLKLEFFGNDISNIKIFSEKSNFKKVIEKSSFKTPIFEKIKDRNSKDIFNEFLPPLRIFSKKNDYYSQKINSLKEIQDIFQEKKVLNEFYVEEYVFGKELFVLVFKNNQDQYKVLTSIKEGDNFRKVSLEYSKEISKKVIEFFNYLELKDFALFNLMDSGEKRNLYFLNIWLKNIDIIKEKDIIENILEEYDDNEIKDIFKKNLF